MNLFLKRLTLSSLAATSLASAALFAAQPAFAGDNLLRDLGIGAGTGAVTGTVTNNDSTLSNTINGAAAGAAVHTVHQASDSNSGNGALVRDAGIGAAASALTGIITNRHNPVSNAANGAAAGALINVLGH